jgi:site-specific DNA recombinase
VGLKGTMSALFLKDLAQKTCRGQIGRVKAGRIPGGKSFGYVAAFFAEYAAGKGPIANVKDLNAERIPGPAAVLWIASTILGNPKRRNGLLNNELYRGVIVYNRQRLIKAPATGKRVARENPESEWLRISCWNYYCFAN